MLRIFFSELADLSDCSMNSKNCCEFNAHSLRFMETVINPLASLYRALAFFKCIDSSNHIVHINVLFRDFGKLPVAGDVRLWKLVEMD